MLPTSARITTILYTGALRATGKVIFTATPFPIGDQVAISIPKRATRQQFFRSVGVVLSPTS